MNSVYGNKIFIRGLIECTSYCRNNCYYCGLRAASDKAQRFRLTKDQILDCCRKGYEQGFRTFVLQGGEDPVFIYGSDSSGPDDPRNLAEIVAEIRSGFPDCAITLSFGEMSRAAYQALFDAGADRYLLRHETISKEHYEKLHPPEMSYENRMRCLQDLKDIGYQVGCGFMVGTPGQTPEMLDMELEFLKKFKPDMIGIGPFIPATGTPMAGEAAGTAEATIEMLGRIRAELPKVLLPSTTALGTISEDGRIAGFKAGANVVMPNISPADARDKYTIYDKKLRTGAESGEGLEALRRQAKQAGYEIVIDRGDAPGFKK